MPSQPVTFARNTEPAGPASDPALAAAEALSFDYVGHAWLRDVRWRRPPYDRRGIAVALLVALVLHLVGFWLVRDWMKLHLPEEDRRDVIQVSLVEPVAPAPVSPPEPIPEIVPETVPSPVEAPRPVPRAATRPSRSPAAAAPAASAVPATPGVPQVHLYGPDGRLDVSTLEHAPEAGPYYEFRPPTVVQSPMMKHDSPLPYKPTAFEELWPSDKETALDAFIRRNTVSKTTRTKWGGQISCSWMLFIGGCGFGYAPPNPEGLKKMRANPPMKTVPKEMLEPAVPPEGEGKSLLNLKLQELVPVPEAKPEDDGSR